MQIARDLILRETTFMFFFILFSVFLNLYTKRSETSLDFSFFLEIYLNSIY